MTGRIRELLKSYTPLTDKYISLGSLEEATDTFAVTPEGRDYALREYTDGTAIREMRFKVQGRLPEGKGEDIENLRFMQGISDYLTSTEYPDAVIMGFRQVAPPVMVGRKSNTAVYAFTAEVIYRN